MPFTCPSDGDGPEDAREARDDLIPVPDAVDTGARRALVPGAVEEEDREGQGDEGLGGPAPVLDEDVESQGRCRLSLVILPRCGQ